MGWDGMGRSGGGCTRSPCLKGNFNKSYSRVHSITIFTFPSRAVCDGNHPPKRHRILPAHHHISLAERER